MVNGVCKRGFPKDYEPYTRIIEDGYPKYKRRYDGKQFEKKMTNRNVVPFNPVLLKMYQEHINVEATTEILSPKYLFKYVYKGFDCADMNIRPENG